MVHSNHMHDWSDHQLIEIISQALERKTETHTVEFKEAAGGSPYKSLWRTISAFSNSYSGGVIVFGVKEHEDKTPEVVGVKDLGRLQEQLVAYLSDKMVNCGKYSLKILSLKGKDVLALAISELPHENKPCYYKDNGLPRGACIRVGNVDKQITDQELKSFLQYSSQYKFDQTIINAVTDKDLSAEKIDHFFKKSAERTGRAVQPENYIKTLQNLKLITTVDKVIHPTLAGFMFFAKEPPQDYAEASRYIIQCVRYHGTGRSTQIIDKQSIIGTIDEQVETAVNFVRRNIQVHARITDTKRVDTFEYPIPAVREAVINALVHRDYSNVGTLIQLAIYSNRIELSNPGTLPPGMTIDMLRESHFSRNPVIAGAMRSLDYIEEFGQGIDLMYREMKTWKLPTPLFMDVANQFHVIFLGEQFRPLNKRQVRIWHHLRFHHEALAAELQGLLPNVTRRTLNRDLDEMTELGFITSEGATTSLTYQIVL